MWLVGGCGGCKNKLRLLLLEAVFAAAESLAPRLQM